MQTNAICTLCQMSFPVSSPNSAGESLSCPQCDANAAEVPWWAAAPTLVRQSKSAVVVAPSAPAAVVTEAPWWTAAPTTVRLSAPEPVPSTVNDTPWWAAPPLPERPVISSPSAAPGPLARQPRSFVRVYLAGGVLCCVLLAAGLVFCVQRVEQETPIAISQNDSVAHQDRQAVAAGKNSLLVPAKAAVQQQAPPEPKKQGPPIQVRPPEIDDADRLGELDTKKPQPPEPVVEPKKALEKPTVPMDAKVAKLLRLLQSPVVANRLAAMKALGNRGTAGKDALPLLLKSLRRDNNDEAGQAARTLAQIGAPAVTDLAKALQDPAPLVRRWALWALAVIGPSAKEAVEPIGDCLKDKDASMRMLAAQALAQMGLIARAAAPLLGQALRDADPQVRVWALEALRQTSGPEGVRHLLPMLKDADLSLRVSAVQALVRFQESEEALRALVESLRDPKMPVRTAAASVLAQLGPEARTALPALLESLKENDLTLQIQVFTAIMGIGSPQDAELLNTLGVISVSEGWARPALLKQAEPNRRREIQRLLLALQHPNATRRLGAVLALGQMGANASESLPFLRKCLDDPNSAVQAATMLALPAIDAREKTEAKAATLITDICNHLKASQKIDPEALIRLHLLVSTIGRAQFQVNQPDGNMKDIVATTRIWVNKAVDELPYAPWTIPAFVRGINIAAEFDLGFTEPFSRLSFKFQALVADARDIPSLSYAVSSLGEGVGVGSHYLAALQWNRFQAFTNATYLDWLILTKEEEIARKITLSVVVVERPPTNPSNFTPKYWQVCHPFRALANKPMDMLPPDFGFSHDHSGGTQLLPGMRPVGLAKDQFDLQYLYLLKAQLYFTKTQQMTRQMSSESNSELVAKLQDPSPWFRWMAANLIGRKPFPPRKN